ncbi:MAG: hypothetical protein MJ180_03840 [Candidatus Gastranaerophilales bacterium]|nr:hypothetical protein [Candidatus Gastranaerophilales bacterium]
MKNFIFIFLFVFIISSVTYAREELPSNESFYRESATKENIINSELKENNIKQIDNKDKQEIKPIKTKKGLTNYQYDEANLHYYKFQKYVQDNINYSKSGKMKY